MILFLFPMEIRHTEAVAGRSYIVANWPPIYLGKGSERHREGGEDTSLLISKPSERVTLWPQPTSN